jgi:integrase
MARLTALALKNAPDGKKLSDGGGLFYRRRGKNVQWLFRWQTDGKVREVSIGGAELSLSDARLKAAATKSGLKDGKHPAPQARSAALSLEAAVRDFIIHAKGAWRSQTELKHTDNQLRHHFGHLYERDIASLTKGDIVEVMRKVWDSPAVADRLLSRISRVLGRQAALDHVLTNVADSKTVRMLLPKVRHVQEHHPAIAVVDAPSVWKRLVARDTLAASALKLIILTATRSGEARGAEWNEFDLKNEVWVVPENRTKTGKVLEVPMSPSVVSLVKNIPRVHDRLLFAGRTGRPLTDMAVLKEMRLLDDVAVVHGWRSTFRDFGGERRFDRDLLELCLNHVVGAVERAYSRSGHTELRRPIMNAWADFLKLGNLGNP